MNKNKWFLNGGRGSGRSFRLLCETYENKIAELEKENAEAKEIIRELLTCARNYPESSKQKMQKAEAFLNSEVEK